MEEATGKAQRWPETGATTRSALSAGSGGWRLDTRAEALSSPAHRPGSPPHRKARGHSGRESPPIVTSALSRAGSLLQKDCGFPAARSVTEHKPSTEALHNGCATSAARSQQLCPPGRRARSLQARRRSGGQAVVRWPSSCARLWHPRALHISLCPARAA